MGQAVIGEELAQLGEGGKGGGGVQGAAQAVGGVVASPQLIEENVQDGGHVHLHAVLAQGGQHPVIHIVPGVGHGDAQGGENVGADIHGAEEHGFRAGVGPALEGVGHQHLGQETPRRLLIAGEGRQVEQRAPHGVFHRQVVGQAHDHVGTLARADGQQQRVDRGGHAAGGQDVDVDRHAGFRGEIRVDALLRICPILAPLTQSSRGLPEYAPVSPAATAL